jgi:FRG domain
MPHKLIRGVINSVGGLIDWVSGNGSFRVFRGQRSSKWPLVPSVQRHGAVDATSPAKRLAHEIEMLERFQRKARPHLSHPPPDTDRWDWMAIAQHYGMPTRLLDWTDSAACALFFAVEGSTDENGAALWVSELPPVAQTRLVDPFTVANINLYEPPHFSPRITVQQSCFTVHPTDYVGQAYEWPGKLAKLLVPVESRQAILEELRVLGVRRSTLFPELEGIASDIRTSFSSSGSK